MESSTPPPNRRCAGSKVLLSLSGYGWQLQGVENRLNQSVKIFRDSELDPVVVLRIQSRCPASIFTSANVSVTVRIRAPLRAARDTADSNNAGVQP